MEAIQGLGKWREIILQISPSRAANLLLGRHQIQTWTTCSEWHAMFVHPEPYVRPTQNTSIPWGEELALSQCCLTELFRYSKTVNALNNTSTCTWFVSKVRRLWQCANIATMLLIDSSALLIIVAAPINKEYMLAEVCFAANREMRLHLHLIKASINETTYKNNSLAWLATP